MFLLEKLKKYHLVLASKSPRRQELLSQMGITFSVCDSFVDEYVCQNVSTYKLAQSLAQQKAEAVFELYKNQENIIVIGGDTIVTHKEEIMGKPLDRSDAIRMLKILSGKQHSVISGLCVILHGQIHTAYDEAKVSFSELSADDLTYYVDHYAPYDKAGAYGIQEWIGFRGIEHIEGSFFTIMGLPTHVLWQMLERLLNKK
ncbi:MAG: Maf family protein [Bacteroidales bacterium]|jgi:septum formation protein|nr:Maf family protein [Bacteroidales bacterium]MDD3330814.1 Maf family protein [Bacteroidales bacterium]MDD3691389.1 Maf family protein [Bacteroidales bacterium]MDD4581802.1 Maf family protein [Bacteroidales bacterium]